jgi:hypothetical protein
MPYARSDCFVRSGFFSLPEKFPQIFSLSLCQNRVLGVSSYRGAKSIFPRARSPPPFLGSQEKSTARKGSAELKRPFARRTAQLCGFLDGTKKFLKYFSPDFAKTAFSG